jgi:hypothetical protein
LGRLEIVLDLHDACWCGSVARNISHLDGEAAANCLAVDHVVDDRSAMFGD